VHGLRRAAAAAVLLCLGASAQAQAPGLGASAELVDPHAFRVCADPNDLPFSNTAHQGFENKIAELLAAKLGRPVYYTFFPQIIGFARNTLNVYRCDVVMGDAQGDDLMQTTNPYYTASYALVFRPGHGLDGVTSLADPRLHGRHIGVIARTPPATLMVENGLMADAKPYELTVDTRVEQPTRDMIRDVESGAIDAGVLWGPIAGYYAKSADPKLTVVPLLGDKSPGMMFRIAMGVRHSDQAWKRTLNQLIAQNQAAIDAILRDYGVPLLDDQGNPLPQ
jgi:quinoprotein dehydrogenase-associated probable ABC transporter substrate-binding protein